MTTIVTSLSNPLTLDVVSIDRGGRIGMTYCPGRSDDVALFETIWRRDLRADLAAIRALEPALLITLNEPHEFAKMGVPHFVSKLFASELPWRHVPIRDAGMPDSAFERAWEYVGRDARNHLRAGRLVIVHGRSGVGRAGTIAARLLAELGVDPLDALARVRRVRPGAIETRSQELSVMRTPVVPDRRFALVSRGPRFV